MSSTPGGWSWLAGSALAVVGVVLSRVVAPATAHGLAVRAAGDVVALSGLLVIALGIGRRYRDQPPQGGGR
jgi:hypothetical protein